MREIKFRAWNKYKKEMEYMSDLYWFEENHVEDVKQEDYKIMQYTGLKDKNGKEIYEGDILISEEMVVGSELHILEVVFDKGRFCQKTKYLKPDIWLKWNEIEVIGNIYENPELLESD